MNTNKNLQSIARKTCAALLTTAILFTNMPVAAAASNGLSSGLTQGNVTVSLQEVGVSNAAHLDDGIYFISRSDNAFMCLNNQFRKVSGGAVLDPIDYQDNELWILKNTQNNAFTLSPYYANNYYLAGQLSGAQLRLRYLDTSANCQWKAVSNGSYYTLVNCQSGLVMGVLGSSTTGAQVVNVAKTNSQAKTAWTIGRVSEFTNRLTPGSTGTIKDGLYSLRLKANSNKCVNVQFAVTAGNGTAKLCTDTYNQEQNETFYITHRGNNRYTISPQNSPNVCLNVWAANPIGGSKNQLTLATYQPGDECSLWIPYSNSDGTISWMNAKTHLFMNIWLNHTTDGTPVIAYYFDDSDAGRFYVKAAATNSASTSTQSGYAAYTGVNYRAQTSNSRRIAACDKAVQMATVLWTAPCSFPTWKSSGGSYNTVTATDGTSGTKFVAGKTYQGIPYSMAGRTYDDTRWLQLVRSGMTASSMTGKYYTSRADTTAKGIDCSYLVCTALNAGCGTSINLNTASMLSSSKFKKISRSEMLPGDVFLKSGHTMLYLGKTSSGKYAVVEANASYSRVVYRELSASSLSAYGCYRYTSF